MNFSKLNLNFLNLKNIEILTQILKTLKIFLKFSLNYIIFLKLFRFKYNFINYKINLKTFSMDKLSEEDIDNCMQAFKDLDEDGTDYIKV